MIEFASQHGYWRFSSSVRERARYIHEQETVNFLAAVGDTSAIRATTLNEGTLLFRAQAHYEWEPIGYEDEAHNHPIFTEGVCDLERMVPTATHAGNGRANPLRIPFLYLAEDGETAMSEMRPGKGAYLTVATFPLGKDCRLLDCSRDARTSIILPALKEPDAEAREKRVWGDIAAAFSRPISDAESALEYVPTQILSELFRSKGFDGITFKSSIGQGMNVVLFDTTTAKPHRRSLYEVADIVYTFKESNDDTNHILPEDIARHGSSHVHSSSRIEP